MEKDYEYVRSKSAASTQEDLQTFARLLSFFALLIVVLCRTGVNITSESAVTFSKTFSLALHSTTEFFVFQQLFY